MKLSEFVKILEQIQKKHGDVEVGIWWQWGNGEIEDRDIEEPYMSEGADALILFPDLRDGWVIQPKEVE